MEIESGTEIEFMKENIAMRGRGAEASMNRSNSVEAGRHSLGHGQGPARPLDETTWMISNDERMHVEIRLSSRRRPEHVRVVMCHKTGHL